MTTEAPTKYPFGETPEDVIRDAYDDSDLPRFSNAAVTLYPDKMLTMLDALRKATPMTPGGLPNKKSHPATLRIEILASIGIEES